VDELHGAQETDRQQAFVSTAMNLLFL
jgi:hypothetical protein